MRKQGTGCGVGNPKVIDAQIQDLLSAPIDASKQNKMAKKGKGVKNADVNIMLS